MALKAGPRGPRSEAQGCARTTGFTACGPCAADRRMAFPWAMDGRFRTGADKGNPKKKADLTVMGTHLELR